MDNDLKINISRSFERKVNLGNYEMASFFASYGEEVPASSTLTQLKKKSEELYQLAREDVEMAIIKHRSDALKGAPGFDPSVRRRPAPWRQHKVPDQFKNKTIERLPIRQQDEDVDVAPKDPEEDLI